MLNLNILVLFVTFIYSKPISRHFCKDEFGKSYFCQEDGKFI